MASARLTTVLARRWYVTVAGIMCALMFGALAFSLVPAQYTSTSTLVLVQPRQPSAASANPLLKFDSSLNTAAMVLVQSLSAPQLGPVLGLRKGVDRITVRNEGTIALQQGDTQQPFISVTANSDTPTGAERIVGALVSRAGQDLAERQSELRVPVRGAIRVESVVGVSPAKRVWDLQFKAVAAALALGLALTCVVATAVDRRSRKRAARADRADRAAAQAAPRVPVLDPPTVRIPAPEPGQVNGQGPRIKPRQVV